MEIWHIMCLMNQHLYQQTNGFLYSISLFSLKHKYFYSFNTTRKNKLFDSLKMTFKDDF